MAMGTMALLSLRLQQPGEPPPRRRVKPPISCLSLPMTSKLLSHSPLAHSSSKAFRLSGFYHSSLLSIININIYSSRIILSSSCLSIRHLHLHLRQPHLLPVPQNIIHYRFSKPALPSIATKHTQSPGLSLGGLPPINQQAPLATHQTTRGRRQSSA